MPCGKKPLVKKWDKPRKIRVITPSRYEKNEASVKMHWKKVVTDLELFYKDDQFWESHCDTVRELVGPVIFNRISKIFNLPPEAKAYEPASEKSSIDNSEKYYVPTQSKLRLGAMNKSTYSMTSFEPSLEEEEQEEVQEEQSEQWSVSSERATTLGVKKSRFKSLTKVTSQSKSVPRHMSKSYSRFFSRSQLIQSYSSKTKSVRSEPSIISDASAACTDDDLDVHIGDIGTREKLIQSFLKDRTFYVTVEWCDSKQRKITAGVPQGSCLSPALYALFTNDIPTLEGYLKEGEHDVTLALFADDSARPYTNVKNPHFEMLYCNDSETDMIKWNSKYKVKVFEVSASDEFSKKAEIIAKQISKDFFEWWLALGTVEFKSEIKRPEDIESLFQVWFDEHASQGLVLHPKILPCVLNSIAKFVGVPKASCPKVLKRQIAYDIEGENTPAHLMAFGTSLPHKMKHIPPRNNTEAMWHSVKIPEDLRSMACVWEDVNHLTSTKAFQRWLEQRPHLPMPACLQAGDTLGDKKQQFVVPSDYVLQDKTSSTSAQELALPVSQFSIELKEVLSRLMNQ